MVSIAKSPVETNEQGYQLDVWLLLLVATLVLFGLLMVYSTSMVMSQSRFGTPYHFVSRQGAAAFLGLICMHWCSTLSVATIRRYAPLLLIFGICSLLLPLIPGLGYTANGATRWVKFPGIRFQPSEFAKPCFVIFLASYFARQEAKLSRFSYGLFRPLMLLAGVAALLLLQPDFGSTVILATITIGMALAAGVPLRHLLLLGASLASMGAVLIISSPYRMMRVLSFLDPLKDRFGSGYQLVQSLLAVAAGEINGKGFGNSTQKLHYLPDAHTDFIFAVIAEELGFIGSFLVITLFMLLLWRGLVIASRSCRNTYSFTLAVGLTLLLVVPGMVNIGVVTGLLPTKGLPLPFIGYGGTSMVANLIIVGVLLGLSKQDDTAPPAASESREFWT